MSAPRSSTTQLKWWVQGSGPEPVLLIMGYGMRGSAWSPQIEGLKGRHPVVYYDARGIGDSEPVQGALSILDMVQDALGVLDAAGFERAHIVGVSMGGMVAQELALLVPQRCRSLSLIATHSGGDRVWVPKLSTVKDLALAQVLPGKLRYGRLARLLYPPHYRSGPEQAGLTDRLRDSFADPAPAKTMRAQLAAVRGHDTHDRLSGIRVSTLVMCAGLDRMIAPHLSDRMMQVLPNARLVRYEDAGHGLIFQHRTIVNQALLEHFAAQPAQ